MPEKEPLQNKNNETKNNPKNPKEPVWTYRGYRIQPGEFNTAMVHLYRGEVTRANVWRQRLDATTNWAVIATGAAISVAFSQTRGHHSVILLNMLLITLFWFIEARRYRYYELWSSRIRLMETDFFAAMLVPPFQPAWDWAETLAETLLHPDYPISVWEALGRRFRHNYLWIYIIIATSWIVKLWLHPVKALSVDTLIDRAVLLGIPGLAVMGIVGGFLFLMMLIGAWTIRLHDASGEILPHFNSIPEGENTTPGNNARGKIFPWSRPKGRRQQLLTYIVTNQPQAISDTIIENMQRGVTGIQATGMYTGEDRSMLMCALTDTEVAHLKTLVHQIDQNAFVIVSPAKGVVGKGFEPFEDEKMSL